MSDIEKLVSALREEADAVQAIEWDIPICTSNHIREAADTIERLAGKVELLEADNNSYSEAFADLHNEMANLYYDNTMLKAERDAAVEDLKEIGYCCNCIQCLERDGTGCWCAAENDWLEWDDTCDEWEWRGVDG